MHAIRRGVLAAATVVIGGVGAAVTFGGVAWAMPTDSGQCNASDVTTSVTDNGPGAGSEAYTVTLAARPDVTCQVGGSPQQTRFLYPDGTVTPIATTSANPYSWPQVTVDATHSAQFSIKTPNEPGTPVASLRFNVPSGGENTLTTIPWTPGTIAGGAQFSVVRSAPADH
jgi:hypothetical protein